MKLKLCQIMILNRQDVKGYFSGMKSEILEGTYHLGIGLTTYFGLLNLPRFEIRHYYILKIRHTIIYLMLQ